MCTQALSCTARQKAQGKFKGCLIQCPSYFWENPWTEATYSETREAISHPNILHFLWQKVDGTKLHSHTIDFLI